MTDNWTPNRRASQPMRRGNSDHELVDCPHCKLCARCAPEHLLSEHYGHVSQ